MTTTTLTDRDLTLRNAVIQQLDWDSQVDASAIGVAVRDGVVTLTGFIDTYAGKLAAERAVKRVRGVRAVANDLAVRLRHEHTDTDVAAAAVHALSLRAAMPESVQVSVRNGHVTLTGEVPTLFKRAIAANALRHVPGVHAIANRIRVTPIAAPADVKRQIARALHREADVNARGIDVHVAGNTATLRGRVHTLHEREAAEQAAMHAPGIAHVDNRIELVWPPINQLDEGEIC
jgi:osmotically-inducible protein OsmY